MALVKPLKLRSERIAAKKVVAEDLPVARVIVDTKVYHLDEPYSYLVPAEISESLVTGSIVRVPFGRNMTEGVVVAREEHSLQTGLKFIEAQLSRVPPLTDAQLIFFGIVAKRYGCSLWSVLRLAIPPFSKSGENKAEKPQDTHIHTPTHTRQALLLRQGSSLVEEIQKYVEMREYGKVLVIAPDGKTLSRLAPIADIVVSSEEGKSERYRKYLEANFARSGVIVGSRSSIFIDLSPEDLLIVVDESDENHYERHAPTFNVRDLALLRSQDLSVLFISSSHSLEIERLINIGYLESRESSQDGKVVHSSSTSSPHAIISESLKKGSVLLVHQAAGYVKSFLCNKCKNLAQCDCGERLTLKKDGRGADCSLCGKVQEKWRCSFCSESTPRSLGLGVEKRAEDYGKSFPHIRVISSSSAHRVSELPTETSLVISTPGMEPDGEYSAVLLMDGEQAFGRPGLRSDEQSLLHWSRAANRLTSGGTLYISLPTQHPITQSFTRGSFSKMHRGQIEERTSAKLPPVYRMLVLVGSSGEMHQMQEYFSNDENSSLLELLGPLDQPDGSSRLVLKFDIKVGNEIVKRMHEVNRIRSLQGEKILRVSVDPYDFL